MDKESSKILREDGESEINYSKPYRKTLPKNSKEEEDWSVGADIFPDKNPDADPTSQED